MNQNTENWPPSSSNQPSSVSQQSETFWASFLPLLLSIAGAICLIIGSSAPSTRGLSGQAFTDAFEANEEVMFFPIFGFPLALAGLSIGLMYRRLWSGKIAVTLSLLSITWFFLRQ